MSLARDHDGPRGFVSKSEHYAALAEIDRLRDELAQYRESLAADIRADRVVAVRHWMRTCPNVGLRTATALLSAQLLIALFDAKSVLTHGFTAETVFDRSNSDDVNNLAKVVICRIRAQLKALGAPPNPITTLYCVGYALTPEARAWLKQACPEAFK
jgi:hypothetical protein